MTAILEGHVEDAVSRSVVLARRVLAAENVGHLPHVVEKGTWTWAPTGQGGRWGPDGWSHGSWTGGFAAGTFLLAELLARDPTQSGLLRRAAEVSIARLEGRVTDSSTHDIGFIFWPSAALYHSLYPSDYYSGIALKAAQTLLRRTGNSGLIVSWGEPGDPRTAGMGAIDTMMNLPLLWWASKHGLSPARSAAIDHADASARYFVRDDGTTWHYVRVAPDGRVQERGSKQGLDADSVWSRGLSWAVHGFTTAYIASGEERHLFAARKTATAFFGLLGDRTIPPYDFSATGDDAGYVPDDASAAAVVASALYQGCHAGIEVVPDAMRRADQLVDGLVRDALPAGESDGLLSGTSYSVPEALAIDGGATWGDFFFLRSLMARTIGLDDVRTRSVFEL